MLSLKNPDSLPQQEGMGVHKTKQPTGPKTEPQGKKHEIARRREAQQKETARQMLLDPNTRDQILKA